MDLINQVANRGLIIDGAMSTALEHEEIDTNNDLWTAIALNLSSSFKIF